METKEVLKEGEVKHSSKLNSTSYSLLTTHGCNEIVSVFVSTFLISYIYSISTNYLFNIGLFYAFNYLSMFVFYYLISRIIDKTNRVICYRAAILVRALFILAVVFLTFIFITSFPIVSQLKQLCNKINEQKKENSTFRSLFPTYTQYKKPRSFVP